MHFNKFIKQLREHFGINGYGNGKTNSIEQMKEWAIRTVSINYPEIKCEDMFEIEISDGIANINLSKKFFSQMQDKYPEYVL